MELLTMALVYGAIAIVLLALRRRRRPGTDLRRAFAAVHFETPRGVVGGDAVRVVRVRRQGMFADIDPFDIPPEMLPLAESFWYCVAPGPSYFVAIASADLREARAVPVWTTRALSEAQLRSALADDPPALAAAFAPDGDPAARDVRYTMRAGVARPAPGASRWPAPEPAQPPEVRDAPGDARGRWLRGALAGLAMAVLLVPPLHAFYWGWTHAAGFAPWLAASGRALMGWLVYLYMLADGELLRSAEGRSVALAFVATATLSALMFVPRREVRG